MTYQYVPARTNHILHLVMTMFTFGLWAPVWFTVWLYNHNRTVARLVPQAPVQFSNGQSNGVQLRNASVWADHVWYQAIDPMGQRATWCSTHGSWECAKNARPAVPSQVAR